jgi:hypothetical protein
MLHKIKALNLDREDSQEALIHILTSLHTLCMWCFYRYQEQEGDLHALTEKYVDIMSTFETINENFRHNEGEHEAIDRSFKKMKGKFEEIEDELEAIRAAGGWSPPGRGNPSDWVIQWEDPREPSAPLLLD